jgi:hypothetical protein
MKQYKLYKEVRQWIYRNVRPIDLARWQYQFEGGRGELVISALEAYQNEDGGFGHALEADAWNPNSSPIQTFEAIELLREINFNEADHPIIKGILSYLDSGKDFYNGVWQNIVPSNNVYPHAPWWHMESVSTSHNRFNPSVGLAGFGLCYAKQHSALYEKCSAIAKEAMDYLYQADQIDMHVLICYIALMEYCEKAEVTDLFSMNELKNRLATLVRKCITKDTSIWATSYVCKPSVFFNTPKSIFYPDNKEIAAYECDFIKNTRNSEGVWEVTWGWAGYPGEWAISKNWWKSHIAVSNMLYLRNFEF